MPVCPFCHGSEWKSARLVHAEGLTHTHQRSTGVGVGFGRIGANIGIGRSKSKGMNQTLLSQQATPPRRGHKITLFALLAFFLILMGTAQSETPLAMLLVLICGCICLIKIVRYEQNRNAVAAKHYADTRLCLRCGNFYRVES